MNCEGPPSEDVTLTGCEMCRIPPIRCDFDSGNTCITDILKFVHIVNKTLYCSAGILRPRGSASFTY